MMLRAVRLMSMLTMISGEAGTIKATGGRMGPYNEVCEQSRQAMTGRMIVDGYPMKPIAPVTMDAVMIDEDRW